MSEIMNDKIKKKWDEAEANPGQKIDIGRVVVCDMCDVDYTDLPDMGGFIFTSYAYCPKCAVSHLPKIRGYGEERFIRATCPEGQSFADFVRAQRGPDGNYIRITHGPIT